MTQTHGCKHCGEQEDLEVDDDCGLVCHSCGMVSDAGAALLTQYIEVEAGQKVGQITFDNSAEVIGSSKARGIFQRKITVQQAGEQLGADNEVIREAQKLMESFKHCGRMDFRVASALYLGSMECRKPKGVHQCIAAAGVPKGSRGVKSALMKIKNRLNVPVPFQDPECIVAFDSLNKYQDHFVQLINKDRLDLRLSNATTTNFSTVTSIAQQILDTARQVLDVFETLAVCRTLNGLERAAIAFQMSANFHRRPVNVNHGLVPLVAKLANDDSVSCNSLNSKYNNIKNNLLAWVKENLAQQVQSVPSGKFELRYLESILVAYEVYKDVREEELSTQFANRFESTDCQKSLEDSRRVNLCEMKDGEDVLLIEDASGSQAEADIDGSSQALGRQVEADTNFINKKLMGSQAEAAECVVNFQAVGSQKNDMNNKGNIDPRDMHALGSQLEVGGDQYKTDVINTNSSIDISDNTDINSLGSFREATRGCVDDQEIITKDVEMHAYGSLCEANKNSNNRSNYIQAQQQIRVLGSQKEAIRSLVQSGGTNDSGEVFKNVSNGNLNEDSDQFEFDNDWEEVSNKTIQVRDQDRESSELSELDDEEIKLYIKSKEEVEFDRIFVEMLHQQIQQQSNYCAQHKVNGKRKRT